MTTPKRVEDEDPPWFDEGLVAATSTDDVPWDRPADEPRSAPAWPDAPYTGPAPRFGAPPPASGAGRPNNQRPLRFGNPAAASWRQASRREAASLPAWSDESGVDPYDEFAPLAADLAPQPTASTPRHAVTDRGVPESVFGDFFSLPADARPRRVSLPPVSAQGEPAPMVADKAAESAGYDPVRAAAGDWPPVPTTFAPRSWESVTKPTTPWTGAAVTALSAAAPPSIPPPPPSWADPPAPEPSRAAAQTVASPVAIVEPPLAPVEAGAEEEDSPSTLITVVLIIGTGIFVIGLVLAFLNFLTGVFR